MRPLRAASAALLLLVTAVGSCSPDTLRIHIYFPDQTSRDATTRLMLIAVDPERGLTCPAIVGQTQAVLQEAVLTSASFTLDKSTTFLTLTEVPVRRILVSALAYDAQNRLLLTGCVDAVPGPEGTKVELGLGCAPGIPLIDGKCCLPSCTGNICGAADGCGGVCPTGTCTQPHSTCKGGKCECNWASCGGTCCSSSAHVCTAANTCCRPTCTGRECGPDPTCNIPDACGTCPGDKVCNTQGKCVDKTSWVAVTSGTTQGLYGVWGSSSSDVWAVGDSGTILHYQGGKWSSVTSGTTDDLNAVFGMSAAKIWAVGAGGTILHYNGLGWSAQTSGVSNNLFGIWGSTATGDLYVVGGAGTILHCDTSSSSATWSKMTSGTSLALRAVWGTTADKVWAVGAGGTVLHHDGTSWTGEAGGGPYGHNAIWGSSTSFIRAVGVNGQIRSYDGSSWSGESAPTSQDLNAIWGASTADIWVVGDAGTVLHYNGSWASEPSGVTKRLRGVWGTVGGDIWAVGVGGTILRRQ
jgi:hypothetical protein